MSPPPPPELPIQMAARLLAQGRPALAADRLGEIVRDAPTYAAAHVLRATALESAGDPEGALEAWTAAAALVPRSPLVHRERERLLAQLQAPESDGDLPPPVPADPPATAEPPGPDGASDDEPVALSADDLVTAPPAAEPAPTAPEAPDAGAPRDAPPEAEPPPLVSPYGDVPLPAYGDLQALDASDLLFGGTPEPQAAPDPGAPEPDDDPDDESAAAPAAAGPTDLAEWADPDPSATELLPPEDEPARGADAPVPDDPDDEDGWEVLAEDDLPRPTPASRVEPDVVAPEPTGPTFAVADELDALISQLEDAPRIRPDPEYDGPSVAFDTGDMSEMYSETLAEIYAAQHQYVEAAVVYEKLAQRNPEAADEMLRKAAALRERG